MGTLCTQKLNEIDKGLIIKDLVFENFSSQNDKWFYAEKNNFLQYLTLGEMLQFIYSIESDENSHHLQGNKSYYNEVSVFKLPIYLKNKLFKHPLVLQNTDEGNKEFRTYVNYLNKSFENAYLYYKVIFKKLFNEKLRENQDHLPKLTIIPLLFHLCGTTPNKLKLNIMFNLLSHDSELNRDSKDLYIFLYFLFVYPTSIAIKTMDDQGNEDEDIRKAFPQEAFEKIHNTYEAKDTIVAIDDFLEKLFGTESSINYESFESTFIQKKLYYIFSGPGIRSDLDSRNLCDN